MKKKKKRITQSGWLLEKEHERGTMTVYIIPAIASCWVERVSYSNKMFVGV